MNANCVDMSFHDLESSFVPQAMKISWTEKYPKSAFDILAYSSIISITTCQLLDFLLAFIVVDMLQFKE